MKKKHRPAMRFLLFAIAYLLCNFSVLSQKDAYEVIYVDPVDNPVFSARIFYNDSLIAVHDAELNERIYLDILYSDDAQNYKAGQILFQEFGGRRSTLLELKSCIEASENFESDANLTNCIVQIFLENFRDLSAIKRKNLLMFVSRNT